ncbi:MAG: outer membrane beta-barrel protein [bacterium]|nr:outer membrane beta-barrel protein [bacterium]
MESMRLLRSSLRAGLAAAAGVCILGAAGSAGAQEYRSGFYVGLETGVAIPSGVDSTVSGVNQPTRCDRLLYPASISPPDDAVCRDNTPGVLIANEFDPGVGFASGFIFGYAAGGPRFEVEYVNRYQGDDVKPLGGTKNPRVAGKNTEWANDVEEWIGDHHAHQVFANAYYDFLNDSRWTPYVGAGVGWAVTELSYYTQFTSKPAAEYLQIEFDPDWPEAAKRAAAGTTSILDDKVGKTVFGFQVLAGFDYALTERTSLGAKVRWTRFDDIDGDVMWTQVRSHAPVHADGVTPFGATLAFGGIGYQAVTLALKHRF